MPLGMPCAAIYPIAYLKAGFVYFAFSPAILMAGYIILCLKAFPIAYPFTTPLTMLLIFNFQFSIFNFLRVYLLPLEG